MPSIRQGTIMTMKTLFWQGTNTMKTTFWQGTDHNEDNVLARD